MANYNENWEDLGRSIQNIIDQAINSSDYQRLNQTIRQTVGRAVDMGTEAVRKVMDGSSKPGSELTQAEQQDTERFSRRNLPVLYGRTGSKMAKGVLQTVGGSLLSGCTFLGFLLQAAVDWMFGGTMLLSLSGGVSLIGFAGGIWLLCSGVTTLRKVKRFKTYRRVLGQKSYCALDRLAYSVGKSVKFVRRELWQMIDEGLFLEGHMDKEQTCLITSNETYQRFEQSRRELEERQRQEAAVKTQKAKEIHNPQVQEVLDRGNAFIAQIRKCNDDIPGEEISVKIYRMEEIVQRIFERVEAHPEIVPDLKRLMDYYLPMTVKLLNAYTDMDAQPIQGETIQTSKREIEDTLDTLNLAFEKLLDSVFKDTAMDVSSDISVLNTLLAQEGLAEDDLMKMKKQNTL